MHWRFLSSSIAGLLEEIMPTKIVDLSARSQIVRDESFHVHFWECTPTAYLEYLREPLNFLSAMGINIPQDCRIETTIENHDWIGAHSHSLSRANGTIICNVGGGISREQCIAL